MAKLTAQDVVKLLKKKVAKRNPRAIVLGHEFHNAFDLRRPSGITSLDVYTGGGLPAGGMSEIAGPEGVGKNYLANQYLSMVQQNYGDNAAVAVICFEAVYDKDFARKCGVQIAYDDYEIELLQQRRSAEGQKKLTKKEVDLLKQQQGVFLVIRDEPEYALDQAIEIIRSGTFQVVLVDSWDAALVEDAREKDLSDDEKVGGLAVLQTRFMRKLFSALNSADEDGKPNETTVITLRQVRANIGATRWARQWKVAGAHALRHANLGRILLTPGTKIRDGSKKAIGKEINWEIDKGKAGFHDGPKGSYSYYYEPPRVDIVDDFIHLVVSEGLCRRTPGKDWFIIKDGDNVMFEGTKKDIETVLHDGESMLRSLVIEILLERHGITSVRYV